MARKGPGASALAPATVANLGPGFEVFAIALDGPWDEVTITPSSNPEVTVEGPGAEVIPRDLGTNAAVVPVEFLRSKYGLPEPFSVHVKKGVPPGKGLGSSAASAAAGALAFASFVRERFTVPALVLLRAAAEGERAVVGSPHFDNVAAALLGGFVLVSSREPLALTRIRIPPALHMAIAWPEVMLETRRMREILPREVPMAAAVANVGNASTLALAMAKGDLDLAASCLEDDLVVKHRSRFIPGFERARVAAREAGGLGFSICGSGAAVFSLCRSEDAAERISRAMADSFREEGMEAGNLAARGNNAMPARRSLPGVGAILKLSEIRP